MGEDHSPIGLRAEALSPSCEPRDVTATPSDCLCQSCFRTAETEPVKVLRGERYTGGEWVESTLRRCANDECFALREGSLEDRLAFVRNEYGYKYFGDYELSPAQSTAVWEAYTAAMSSCGLLQAARLALEVAEDWIHDQLDGTGSLDAALAKLDPVRAAIARAEGRQP